MKRISLLILMVAILGMSLFGCRKNNGVEASTEEDLQSTYPDWSEETHSNAVDPDYDVVFAQDQVLRIDLKISEEEWQIMQSDLNSLFSSTGGPGHGPGQTIVTDDPVWVKGSVFFNGKEWYHVGIRYKGNSSLMSAYRSGIKKLSFKLDFDQFEEEFPLLKDQRFYGFKQLNLKNNFDDLSLMREKVGSDLFREFGLASPQTAFCVVYVDYGDGPQYYGVYTIVEEVDDSVIKTQFADGSGNLYKPEGQGATFAQGTFNEADMNKKTNEDDGDYSDVQSLYEILNSDLRTSDVEAWKKQLEAVFDVDVFLKWLAANTTIQNWDTYGRMTHNYYLYHDPTTDKLIWIPWDNNEAFQQGKQGGALSLSLNEVNANWPLIRYLIDVPEYKEKYKAYLKQFVEEVFYPEKMTALYDQYYDLLKEYAYAEQTGYTFLRSPSDFDNAVNELKNHVQSRVDAVLNYLQQ